MSTLITERKRKVRSIRWEIVEKRKSIDFLAFMLTPQRCLWRPGGIGTYTMWLFSTK